MKNRELTSREKMQIALAAIGGQDMEEICAEYGISRTYCCEIRDQLLSEGHLVFDDDDDDDWDDEEGQ